MSVFFSCPKLVYSRRNYRSGAFNPSTHLAALWQRGLVSSKQLLLAVESDLWKDQTLWQHWKRRFSVCEYTHKKVDWLFRQIYFHFQYLLCFLTHGHSLACHPCWFWCGWISSSISHHFENDTHRGTLHRSSMCVTKASSHCLLVRLIEIDCYLSEWHSLLPLLLS